MFTSPEAFYDGIKKNEIISAKYDNSKNTIKKSMIFIVNKPDVAGFFKETGLDSIGDNWEKKDSEDAEKKPGMWKFIPHPLDIKKQVLV